MLVAQRQAPVDATRFTFGKHKGELFSDVFENDKPYVLWTARHLRPTTSANHRAWWQYVEGMVARFEAGQEAASAVASFGALGEDGDDLAAGDPIDPANAAAGDAAAASAAVGDAAAANTAAASEDPIVGTFTADMAALVRTLEHAQFLLGDATRRLRAQPDISSR